MAVIDVTGVCPRRVTSETIAGAGAITGHVVIEKLKHNARIGMVLTRLVNQASDIVRAIVSCIVV